MSEPPKEKLDLLEELIEKAKHDAVLREREECAKLCEQSDRYRGAYFAQKIRERSSNE